MRPCQHTLTLLLYCIFSAFILGLPPPFTIPKDEVDQAESGLAARTAVFLKHSLGHLGRHSGVFIYCFLYFLQHPLRKRASLLHFLAFF